MDSIKNKTKNSQSRRKSNLAKSLNTALIKNGVIRKALSTRQALKEIKSIFDLDKKKTKVNGVPKMRFYFKTLGVGKVAELKQKK